MPKGYPRTRFEIVDQTNVQEIPQSAVSSPIPLPMAVYTSDKGPEEWRLLFNLNQLTSQTGPISFVKHGQAQLTIAEELRRGAVVLSKRMVSADATLANVTIRARVVHAEDASYVYYYALTNDEAKTIEEACEYGCDTENVPDYETISAEPDKYLCDVPLFTVSPMGRGVSGLYFRITPEYTNSKSSTYLRYNFEVYENQELLESISFTMNPEIMIDGVAQGMNPKIQATSTQCKVRCYENELYTYISTLASVAGVKAEDGTVTPYTLNQIANMDFLNGFDRKGTTNIGGLVYKYEEANAVEAAYEKVNTLDARVTRLETKSLETVLPEAEDDLWVANLSDAIKDSVVFPGDAAGLHIEGGSFGSMGIAPIQNPQEYENMLVEVFGGATTVEADGSVEITNLFDPVIYDLDAYKIDFICDCNFPFKAKKAIMNMVDFRGDMVFIMDLGMTATSIGAITRLMEEQGFSNEYFSRYTAIYHNFFKVADPYTGKYIDVTMPYLLAGKLISHIAEGAARPFAGILHNVTFPEIVENSINYLPVEIPGVDQKQMLVDLNVNYLMYYDGTPVMETMYTNISEYTQLSYLHNIMAIQEVIKAIRTQCPKTRYTFLDGKDLQNYIDDATAIINRYATNFSSIEINYMADERYEQNNIFYATIVVKFKNFIQEEFFRVIAIS